MLYEYLKQGARREFFAHRREFHPWIMRKSRIIVIYDRLFWHYCEQFDSPVATIEEGALFLEKLRSALWEKCLDRFAFHGNQKKNASSVFSSTTIQLFKTDKFGGSDIFEDLTLTNSAIAETNQYRTQTKEFLKKRFLRFAVSGASAKRTKLAKFKRMRQAARRPLQFGEKPTLLLRRVLRGKKADWTGLSILFDPIVYQKPIVRETFKQEAVLISEISRR